MKTYKTKELTIEAVQFTKFNDKICLSFCPKAVIASEPIAPQHSLIIMTPIGKMICSMFDWIVKDEDGDFYATQSDNQMWERYEEVKDNKMMGEIKQFKVKPTTVKAIQYDGENYKEVAIIMGCPEDALVNKKDFQKAFEGMGLEKDVWILIYPDGTMGLSKKEAFSNQFELVEPEKI